MSVFYNGRLWVTPAVMSMVDDTAMFNRSAGVGNALAIVGSAQGGEPFKALRFASPEEARAVLIGGEGLKAVEKAFDASAETGGPSEVIFIRIDPATQASLALKNSSAADVIDLKSTAFGRGANATKVKIESGSVSGKKLTTQVGNKLFTQDNVARRAFSVSYTGANATATLDVTSTAVTVTAGAATVIDLADYPTISALVERINSVAGFTAAVLDNNGEKPTLNALDGITAGNVKSLTVNVTADLQAIVDWFNGETEGFVNATRKAGAILVPANLPFTYLAGAADGVASNTEWQKGFDALQTIDVQWVVPISSNPAIHAMTDVHVNYMSNVARRERRAIVGGALGASDADAILAAKAINSDRTSYVHLGVHDYNAAGVLTLYPPYIAAALLAGAFAGVAPGTALTNKSVKIRGVERALRNPTDTDALINGGVLCIEAVQGGYRVVKSITTWLNNQNYNRVEVSVGVATDFVVRSVREAVNDLRGRGASPQLLAEAKSRADSKLRELAKPAPMGPGVIVGDAASPAYRNLTTSLVGDFVSVEFQASPVIPANYVGVGVHIVPYAGTVSA